MAEIFFFLAFFFFFRLLFLMGSDRVQQRRSERLNSTIVLFCRVMTRRGYPGRSLASFGGKRRRRDITGALLFFYFSERTKSC